MLNRVSFQADQSRRWTTSSITVPGTSKTTTWRMRRATGAFQVIGHLLVPPVLPLTPGVLGSTQSVPDGRYQVTVRAYDFAGNAEPEDHPRHGQELSQQVGPRIARRDFRTVAFLDDAEPAPPASCREPVTPGLLAAGRGRLRGDGADSSRGRGCVTTAKSVFTVRRGPPPRAPQPRCRSAGRTGASSARPGRICFGTVVRSGYSSGAGDDQSLASR